MLLSLCMIVKNEEDNLPRCLESVKSIVDEMIIVDTGSTDNTVNIAKSFGAKVYSFPWNGSFSDARNHSLKQAEGEWILIMDADDEMSEEGRQAVPVLIRDSDEDAYFFETISYVGDTPGGDVLLNMNLRLMKNGRGYYYSNSIHEQIYCNILAVNPSAKILNKDVKVYHYGYLNKNIAEHNKRARNISLLEKELSQRPGYPFTLFNLGSEYYAMGENIKAIEYFEESYKKFNPKEGFSSHLILKMVNCYLCLGRFSEALKLCNEGLSYFPVFTDLEYMKGIIQKVSGKPMYALRHFKKCLEMGEAPNYYNVLIGAGTYKAHYMLGETYFYLEDYESAIESYGNSLKENHEYRNGIPNLIKSLLKSELSQKVLENRIEDIRKYADNKFDSMVFDLLIQEKYYELADKYIHKHEKAYGVSAYSRYHRGLCQLYLGKFTKAGKIMGQVKKDKEYLIDAACWQALCSIIDNNFEEADELLAGRKIDSENTRVKVFAVFKTLIQTSNVEVLCDEEVEAEKFTNIIFEILKVLLITRKFDIFEKALGMLNSVSDKSVLLKLAKIYYKEGCYGLSNQELVRSIKLFDLIDFEGAEMLMKLKIKGL